MGALVPEALAAADRLAALGVAADVVCVTSPGLLFERCQARPRAVGGRRAWILDQVFPARPGRAAGHRARRPPAHAGVPRRDQPVRVTAPRRHRFGQSGTLEEVYRYHGIDTDSIVAAALDLID